MSPRWNWDSPTPLAADECAPPTLWSGGEGIPTTGETLSTLPTLWCRPSCFGWWKRVGEDQMIRRRESLVLYTSNDSILSNVM